MKQKKNKVPQGGNLQHILEKSLREQWRGKAAHVEEKREEREGLGGQSVRGKKGESSLSLVKKITRANPQEGAGAYNGLLKHAWGQE